jgi:hypothetical protein
MSFLFFQITAIFMFWNSGLSDPLFNTRLDLPVGLNPRWVAIGDLDGDGALDLAVANQIYYNVSVLLGNGDGTFQDAVNYGVGNNSHSVAIGDLDGDGALDLAVANFGSGDVSVLLGNGDGAFQSEQRYTAGDGPRSIAIGDLDGNGNFDLAVANGVSDDVSVLLGNGDGTFQSEQRYAAGGVPYSIGIGDLDGNGNLDLAVANALDENVSVLLGNGDGTFQTAVNYGVGYSPYSVAVGDLDGDVALDLAVANFYSDDVSVLLGNGDGTFQSEQRYAAGNGPHSIAIGDLDGDAALDLAVANVDDSVSVLLGNGDGTFQDAVNYGVGDAPRSVALGDLDGDGNLDLTTANSIDDTVSVLLQAYVCVDLDEDGYGSSITEICPHQGLDCDDTDPDVNPGTAEGPPGDPTCSDTTDNDCDGLTDLVDSSCVPCLDNDVDGYGDPASMSCTYPERDCNDSNPEVNPGVIEVPGNGIDDDCDPDTRDSYPGWTVVGIDADTPVAASVAVTSTNGHRIAYVTEGDELKYAPCDTECTDPSNWTIVNLGPADGPVKVVLGPGDQPQILYGLSSSSMYTYCTGDCTNPANWTLPITVPAVPVPALLSVDSAGNPRSAAMTMNNDEDLCASYVFCDGNCDDPQNWSDTLVGPCGTSPNFAMAFGFAMNNEVGGQGAPRILTGTFDHMGMYYEFGLACCDESCGNESNWSSSYMWLSLSPPTPIKVDSSGFVHVANWEPSEGLEYVQCTADCCAERNTVNLENKIPMLLTLSSSERPRMVVTDETDFRSEYASCNGQCDQPSNWSFQNLPMPLEPDNLFDMVLDSSDQPLLVYGQGDALFFAQRSQADAWGAASTVTNKAEPASDVLNFLLCLLVPIGAVLVWIGVRRRR